MRSRLRRPMFAAAVAALSLSGAVSAVAPASATGSATDTSVTLVGQTGTVLGPRTLTFKASTSTIIARGDRSDLTISVADGTHWADIELAAPLGGKLNVGTYGGAVRAVGRNSKTPGLDVSADGAGCNMSIGNFRIDQLAFAADGSLAMLEASFTHRCEARTSPALTGVVRYRSVPYAFQLHGRGNDWIAGGTSYAYTGATGKFYVDDRTTSLSLMVDGPLAQRWTMSLGSLDGLPLQAKRTYRVAGADPSADGVMAVGAQSRGCNWVVGTFRLSTLVRDEAGKLTRVAGTFEQFCDGDAGLKGSFAWHS